MHRAPNEIDVPGAGGNEDVRRLAAAVAKCVHLARRIAHHQCALDAEVDAEEIPAARNLPLMPDELPRALEQCFALDRGQRRVRVCPPGKPLGACRCSGVVRWIGELPGEDRAQIGHGAALGGGAIDIRLRPKSEVLPQHFQHPDEAERNPIRIQVRLGRALDQPLDELAHQSRKALILLPANIVIFLP